MRKLWKRIGLVVVLVVLALFGVYRGLPHSSAYKLFPEYTRVHLEAGRSSLSHFRRDEAAPHFGILAYLGEPEAQFYYGTNYYHRHLPIWHDNFDGSGLRWLRLSAGKGYPVAQTFLGLFLQRWSRSEDDHREAFAYLSERAAAGEAIAQIAVGDAHARGLGVPVDAEEAVNWYWPHAEAGIPHAQTRMGDAHANGAGVAQDDAEAMRWYLLAADREYAHAPAAFNIGHMHALGRGVPANFEMAREWWWRAQDGGDIFHLTELVASPEDLGAGIMEEPGDPFAYIPTEADLELRRLGSAFEDFGMYLTPLGRDSRSMVHAAHVSGETDLDYRDNSHPIRFAPFTHDVALLSPELRLTYSLMHMAGIGVPQSFVQAQLWFNLALRDGFGNIELGFNSLSNFLTPNQRAAVATAYEEWNPLAELSSRGRERNWLSD